jgi:hypothetical protein
LKSRNSVIDRESIISEFRNIHIYLSAIETDINEVVDYSIKYSENKNLRQKKLLNNDDFSDKSIVYLN